VNSIVLPFAMDQAVECGLVEDVHDTDRVLSYVEQAAMHTSELGNRRYGDYIFLIDTEGRVASVNALVTDPCKLCKGTGKEFVFEACSSCEGDGCRFCGNEGGFSVPIKCQHCH
jgi:hypothetical protein